MLTGSHPEPTSIWDIGRHSLKQGISGDFAAERPGIGIWHRQEKAGHTQLWVSVQKESRFLQGARARCQASGRHALATLTQASWGDRNTPKFGAELTFVPGRDCPFGTNRICIRCKMSEKAAVREWGGVRTGKAVQARRNTAAIPHPQCPPTSEPHCWLLIKVPG